MTDDEFKVVLDLVDITHEEFHKLDREITRQRLRFEASGELYPIHEEIIKPTLDITGDSVLLDYGVGEGKHLGSYRDFNIFGIDTNKDQIATAKLNAAGFGIPPTRIALANLWTPYRAENSIDNIMAISSLHNSIDYMHDLKQMDRLLADDGRLVIIERASAAFEYTPQRKRIREIPSNVIPWLRQNGYSANMETFQMDYWGTGRDGPLFNFYMIIADKIGSR